jgi:LPXTG-site transpeptidase (sortase) family protein
VDGRVDGRGGEDECHGPPLIDDVKHYDGVVGMRRTRSGEPTSGGPTVEKTGRRRWSWKRWLANIMIVAGVLLLAYPIATWGYTWWEQRGLRQQLEKSNPGMASGQAALASSDLVPMGMRAQKALESAGAAAAAAKAEAERVARIAAFRAAADAFALRIEGKIGEPIGKIIIQSIGLDVVMIEGAGRGDLREGPGHWPETPFPGQGGNFVVSGHRTTYGAPFRKFDKVKAGDAIELVLPYAIAHYTVTRVIIVYPDEVEEVAQLGREQVSLAACHPLYSAKQRIVVQGDLVGFKLIDASGG